MAREHSPEEFSRISDAELRVMRLLWSAGESSPAALQEALAAEGVDWAYTTVQTLLHRLLRKGYVTRRREGVARLYSAALDRDALLLAHVVDLADRLCEGAAATLLLSLVRSRGLTPDDLARLRAVIDELDDDEGA